jgi:hypothetical protein
MGDILILIPDKTNGNGALTGLLPIYAISGLDRPHPSVPDPSDSAA